MEASRTRAAPGTPGMSRNCLKILGAQLELVLQATHIKQLRLCLHVADDKEAQLRARERNVGQTPSEELRAV